MEQVVAACGKSFEFCKLLISRVSKNGGKILWKNSRKIPYTTVANEQMHCGRRCGTIRRYSLYAPSGLRPPAAFAAAVPARAFLYRLRLLSATHLEPLQTLQ